MKGAKYKDVEQLQLGLLPNICMPHRICACFLSPSSRSSHPLHAGCSLSNTDAPSIYLFLSPQPQPSGQYPRSSATKDMVNAIDRKPLSSLSTVCLSSLLISSYLSHLIHQDDPSLWLRCATQIHALDIYSCMPGWYCQHSRGPGTQDWLRLQPRCCLLLILPHLRNIIIASAATHRPFISVTIK